MVEQVKLDDAKRDHSKERLTREEQYEIEMFHQLKKDPYFNHYLKNHLRRLNEEIDETNVSAPNGPMQAHLPDYVRFDRINLLDFRNLHGNRNRKTNLREDGRTVGTAKRKTSRAVVYIKAGSGKITVNRKPFLHYFRIPLQRHQLLLPVEVGRMTSLIDINIRVWGGGWRSQSRACVPAICRALKAFDPNAGRLVK